MRHLALVCLLAACSSAVRGRSSETGGESGEGGSTGGATGGGTGGKTGGGTGGKAAGGTGGVVTDTGGAGGGGGGTGGSAPPKDAGGDPPPPRDGGAMTSTGPGVVARGYDNKRTGAHLGETVLRPDMVKTGSFGRLYCRPVDDEIYGQILYIPALDLGAKGKHDTLLVVTMNDSVYAFDAMDPMAPALWEQHYTNAASGVTAVPVRDLAK